MKSYDFAIKNRHFEKTLRVNRDHLEDDELVRLLRNAGGGSRRGCVAASRPTRRDAAENGFTTLCYDGQYFFDTDHPYAAASVSTTTQSNKGTTALSSASYSAARAQMMALKDDGGEVMDIVPRPPHRSARARGNRAQHPQRQPNLRTGTPQNNVWVNSANLLCPAAAHGREQLVLSDTKHALRGLKMQFRKRPELVSLVSSQDQNVFRRNELLWGVDYRGEAGYSLWQLMFGAAVT